MNFNWNQFESVLLTWQDSLTFILLSVVEIYQLFSPASQNWTVFKHLKTDKPVFFFSTEMSRLTPMNKNAQQKKSWIITVQNLATFQSSFHHNMKRWACGASVKRKLLQLLQVTLDSLTLLSLFFLQLEPNKWSQQVLLSVFPHNSSSMKFEIFKLVALSGLTHLLKRLEESRSEMRITLTYVL